MGLHVYTFHVVLLVKRDPAAHARSWFLTEMNGWIEKNSQTVPDHRTFHTSDALAATPKFSVQGYRIVVQTTTGSAIGPNDAASDSTFLISFLGSGGFEPPQTL
jgi:hypothetical protein|eukprot:COSAG01_NODE_230_length_21075_cov_13.811603_15_plen_104_part_00